MYGSRVLSTSTSAASNSDPHFKNVSFLLATTGINGGDNDTFIDSAPSPTTITRNGNSMQGAFSPYGANWSTWYESSNSYSSIVNASTPKFGSGNFTIECWIKPHATGTNKFIVTDYNQDTGIGQWALQWLSTGAVRFYYNYTTGNDSQWIESFGVTADLGKWSHIAVVRNGTTLRLYINGTQAATANVSTNSLNASTTQPILIGKAGTAAVGSFGGFISNLRITTNAVYTGAFAPPTSPLTAISGTVLLTCHASRIYDGSANAVTVTPNGATWARRLSPFAPLNEYTPATTGGSMYFDGNGDYLTFPAAAQTNLGGDFTIELWAYVTKTGLQVMTTLQSGPVLELSFVGNGQVYFYNGVQSYYTTAATSPANLYQWNHIAVSYTASNTTLRIFVNGIQAFIGTAIGKSWSDGTGWKIGQWVSGTGYDFGGYMSDIRIVNGTALYTSNFTPSTSPLTAVTNTARLFKFQNANVYDATANEVLRTVSTATVSSTQSKYGGTSVTFNGSNTYLELPVNPGFSFGSGDFTIEYWMYWNASGTPRNIIETRTADNPTPYVCSIGSTGLPYLFDGSISRTSSVAVSVGAWTHVAFSRTNGVLKIYVNGVEGYNSAMSNTLDATSWVLKIGGSSFGAPFFYNGYLDELRITTGVGRYNSAFTPSTTAFQTK